MERMTSRNTQIGIILARKMNVPALKRRRVTLQATALAMLCALLTAGQSVAVKLAVAEMPPYQVMTLRFVMACGVIGVFALVTRQTLALSWRQLLLPLCSALFMFTQIGLYTVGTKHTTSVNSIVIINSFPFFAAVACHYFLPGFEFTWKNVTGMAIASLGVLAVFGGEVSLYGQTDLAGNLMVLAAAVVIGAKTAFVKHQLGTLGPLQLVFWELILTTPMFFLASVVFEGLPTWTFGAGALVAVFYQGVAVSGVSFLLWMVLLSRHSPNEINVFRLTTPFLGVLLGWLILNEPVTPHLLLGGVLLVTGIYWTTR